MPNPTIAKKTGDSQEEVMKSLILRHLTSTLARYAPTATPRDWWVASSLAVRDAIHERMIATQMVHNAQNTRRVYYFSMEYLMGRLFESNLLATGLTEAVRGALQSLGVSFDVVREAEVDMGLGNGGLGRLAACFLDSLATLDYPALGYGIHYEFGLFQQEIVNGNQVEHPDRWMLFGSPWEVIRADYTQEVKLYGRVINAFDDHGNSRPSWVDTRTVLGVPHDIPTAGFGTKTVNLLRLWASRSSDDFDLAAFNSGRLRRGGPGEGDRRDDLEGALSERQDGERQGAAPRPAVLLRLLLDPGHHPAPFPHPRGTRGRTSPTRSRSSSTTPTRRSRSWSSCGSFSTRRTWPGTRPGRSRPARSPTRTTPCCRRRWRNGACPLFERVLPRHLQIIYDINVRILALCEAKWPGDDGKKRACSLIEENGQKMVRMANLAVVGTHAVNGVAALHTALLRKHLFPEFDALYPGKFQNKTNGITPRRWLLQCNPRLAGARHAVAWRRGLGARPRPAARAREIRRRRRVPARIHGGQAGEQGGPRPGDQGRVRRHRVARTRSSTPRSSASTSTSAST